MYSIDGSGSIKMYSIDVSGSTKDNEPATFLLILNQTQTDPPLKPFSTHDLDCKNESKTVWETKLEYFSLRCKIITEKWSPVSGESRSGPNERALLWSRVE